MEGFRFVAEALPPPEAGQDPATISLPTMAEYEEFLSTDNQFAGMGLTFDSSLGSVIEVAQSFVEQRKAAAGKGIFVTKLHRDAPQMLRLWPDARFIHLIRDPRAMAKSGVAKDWGFNTYLSAQKWVETEREWNELCQWVPADRRIEIRFEDLATDHEAALAPVLAFLGVTYDPEMLSYVAPTDYDRPNPAKADEWRTTMSEREIQLAEARVGELLTERGYEPSGLPALDVGANELKKIKAEATAKKWKHKLEEYGPYFLAEFAARKVGVRSIEVKCKTEMNKRERASRIRSWREDGREYAYSPSRKAELGLAPDAP